MCLSAFLQIDMEVPYVFNQIAIQGHDQSPYWITEFNLYYSDDSVAWTAHTDDAGNFMSFDSKVIVMFSFVLSYIACHINLTIPHLVSIFFGIILKNSSFTVT